MEPWSGRCCQHQLGSGRGASVSETKTCSACKQSKPLDLANWQHRKDTADGWRHACRECSNAQRRDRRAVTREMQQTNTLVVLSDMHFPEHDRAVWATTKELLAEVKPSEVVLLGDFLEMGSVSQHGGGDLEKLTEDFSAGKTALKELREIVGEDCRITYLEGNHESRLSRFIMAKAPSLKDSLSYEIGLELKALNIEWVPEYKQPVQRGMLDLTHGHQDLRERPSKYHAAKMADVYGRPGRTVLYGHTHKPQTFTRPTVGGHATAVGMGCGRTLSPGWLHGAQAGWVHQIAVVYLTEAGRPHIYPITFQHGQAMWQGRLYGARVEETPSK